MATHDSLPTVSVDEDSKILLAEPIAFAACSAPSIRSIAFSRRRPRGLALLAAALDNTAFGTYGNRKTAMLLFWPNVYIGEGRLSIRRRPWKPRSETGRTTLFGAREDPGKKTDLAGEHPDVVVGLTAARSPHLQQL